jgi:hypothetical protein
VQPQKVRFGILSAAFGVIYDGENRRSFLGLGPNRLPASFSFLEVGFFDTQRASSSDDNNRHPNRSRDTASSLSWNTRRAVANPTNHYTAPHHRLFLPQWSIQETWWSEADKSRKWQNPNKTEQRSVFRQGPHLAIPSLLSAYTFVDPTPRANSDACFSFLFGRRNQR